MDEQELRQIIRLILEAIEEIRRPKRALVLFTGALLGFEECLAPLAELKQAGLQMTVVKTQTAEFLLDKAKIDALGMAAPGPGLIESNDILIVPTCSVNTVAKVAHGIADTLATNLISEFLSFGKLVAAASTAADPDSAAKQARFPLMPPAQAALMRDNLNKARALGIRFCEVADLASCVRATLGMPGPVAAVPDAPAVLADEPAAEIFDCPLNLVAAHHIQPLPAGSVVQVKPGAIVTALAADWARKRSIRIERA